MSKEIETGRVKPTPAQPAMAKLGETLPERVTHAEMRSQAMGPFAFKSPLAPTVQGINPPTGPGDPIAAAPRMPTPSPRNVKE
jgi:hypothetical protein